VPSVELVDVDDGVGEAPGAVVAVRAEGGVEGLPAEEAEGVPGVPRRVVRRGYHLHHAPHDLVPLGGVRGEDGAASGVQVDPDDHVGAQVVVDVVVDAAVGAEGLVAREAERVPPAGLGE